MKTRWGAKQTGFTIVELLIVIVVIAILAAITLVSFRGIQEKAKNATIVSTIDGWEKAIRMAAINGDTLPLVGACLGKSGDFPAGEGFALNDCVTIDGASGVSYSDVNFSGWTTTTRPSGRMPAVSYNLSGTILKGRGSWVFSHSVPTKSIVIAWIAQIDGSCARGNPATTPIAGSIVGGYCTLQINY